MQRNDVFHTKFSRCKKGEAMRIVTTFLFAVTAVALVGTGTASAAPPAAGAVCKAAAAASMVSKAHCRVVRKCGYFGCSYE
jgi:hypothetical protein